MDDNTPHLMLRRWFYEEMRNLGLHTADPAKVNLPFRLCHVDPNRTRRLADEFLRLELADVVFRNENTVFMQPRPLMVLLCSATPRENNGVTRLMIREVIIAVVIPDRSDECPS